MSSLFARDDTFFGVCQGLGEDLGFDPNILRLALAVPLFFNPVATIAGYAIAGVVVFAVRRLVPEPAAAFEEAVAEEAVLEPAHELPLAA